MEYLFIIKDSKYDTYKKVAASIFLLNALLFFFMGLKSTSISAKIILVTAALLLVSYAVYFWKYKKKTERSFIFLYLFIAAVWAIETSSWYFAIVYILLLFVQLKVEQEPSIKVSTKNLTVDGFIKTEHEWVNITNVILNGGLLTIDFSNNKILQVEPDWQLTDTEKEYEMLEKEFNEFCSQQISK